MMLFSSRRGSDLKQIVGWGLGLLLCCGLILSQSSLAIAQTIPGLGLTEEDTDVIPYSSIPTFEAGNLYIAPVFLDGRILGTVTYSASTNYARSNDTSPTQNSQRRIASERAYLIHNKLQKILHSMHHYTQNVLVAKEGILDPLIQEKELSDNLKIDVVASKDSYAVTIGFPSDDVPQILYTVTRSDIERPRLRSSDPQRIAERAAVDVRADLLAAWRERQRPHLINQARKAIVILIGLSLASLLILLLQKFLNHRRNIFQNRLSQLPTTELSNTLPEEKNKANQSNHFTQNLRLKFKLAQQVSLNALYRSLSFWSQGFLWVLGIGYLFSLFYWTRPLSNWIMGVSISGTLVRYNEGSQSLVFPPLDWLLSFGKESTLGLPLWILLLIVLIRITLKIGDAACDYFARSWTHHARNNRRQLRASTVASMFKNWLRALVYLLVGIFIAHHIRQLGAFTQTLTILLGVMGFAISLASQSLLKDLISGVLILWEDQYAVGDVIFVGDYAGGVEKLSLRITQLRNLDGELITIPNGEISVVRNLSSEWSRVNYAVEVSYEADIDAVLAVINRVAQELAQAPDWQDLILETPEVLGIDNLSSTGVLIRLIIKTQPLQQWAVAREFRYRLKLAFDKSGIHIGIPKHHLMLEPNLAAIATDNLAQN